MIKYLFFIFALYVSLNSSAQNKIASYFPPLHKWEHTPAQLYFDTSKLAKAIAFAKDHESKQPRNMEMAQAMSFGKEPFGFGIGPFTDRGDATGLIIHKGYIIAEWGDPARVDMTHSVTKSFLTTVVGLAVDKGLIKNVYDTVANYVPPVEVYDPLNNDVRELNSTFLLNPFSGEHNKRLTWDVMLRQTSDWEGSLWGKPDWADRPEADVTKWQNRKRNEPGTVWEYNDVRVNALALAATCVWGKSLPRVLKENIMDPIGASSTWQWFGYRNSWIVLNGQLVQSVSGGGHWGGGMFINAFDMGRFGLLTLHKGSWNGKQLLSKSWIEKALTPTTAQPTYGFMNFFLNTDKKYLPSAPASAFVHVGNGTNIIYVDPEHDLVMVVRWIDNKQIDGMIKQVLEAMK